MSGKTLSLVKASDFRRTFREGKRFSSPHFVLYIRENGLPASRIGISIAKAHFRLATRRNKLRRVAKERFRQKPDVHSKGYDVVVASKARYHDKNLKEALNELADIFNKLLS